MMWVMSVDGRIARGAMSAAMRREKKRPESVRQLLSASEIPE